MGKLLNVKQLFKNDELNKLKSYKLLCRLLEDQIIETSSELKEDEDISSDSLQNSHDEDATFRRKGKNLLRVTLLTSVKQQTRTTRYR